jgi:hypothetical protein
MTTISSAETPSTSQGLRAQPTTRVRKVVGAAALVLAPWGFLLANSAYAWATRNGGDDYTGAHAVALARANPDLMRFAVICVMLGCLLVVPAMITAMRLLRPHSPRLSLFAGSAMIVGYCCYFGAVTQNFVTLAMAEHGGSTNAFAEVLDASQSMVSGTWAFILFAFGNLVGTLLFAVAMIRSRAAVPLWAALAVLAWPVLHVTGLALGSEWYEVTGAALQAAGFAAMAVLVLRIPDEEWDPAAPTSVG